VTIRCAAIFAALSATAAFLAGCHRDGCVGGDDGSCVPPTACAALHYSCPGGTLSVTQLAEGFTPLPGPKASAVPGDILLENDLVRVVLAAPTHPSGLAPTGGAILDLSLAGGGDQINSIYQAAGLLPRDAVHYDSYQIDEHRGEDTTDVFVAVVFRGHLEGDSRTTVVTRYELRACEPGVRVRSDLYNGASDPNTLYLADGLFWGDNSNAPFAPGAGLGFRAPKVELRHIDSAWREWPFVAARTQAPPQGSYAVIPCDRPQSAGFNDPTLTASGVPLVTTLPGDGIHFERFIVAAAGTGLAPAVGEALRARAMVHGESPPVTVSGRVVAGGTPIDGTSGRAASLLFYEPAFGPDPDDPARRTPWSEAVPERGGTFSVVLPPDRVYRAQPYAFGRPAGAATSFVVARDDVNIGDITLTAPAHLEATVATAPGQPTPEGMTFAELVIVPVEPPGSAEPPSLYGLFAGCNPMLGPPHGDSPACNRAVTRDGHFDLLIPAGQYYVYATRGPFATLDRGQITVAPGESTRLALVVESLPLLPAGVVSGDLHVHGAASYDSPFPDQDRIASLLAAGLDVVVATDHDVVTEYDSTLLMDLGARGRITIIPGVEQTPNIPWFAVPGADLPRTLGHMNFWPLVVDRTLPGNGAPWDELREPGQMMDDIGPRFIGAGVRQLNHPFAGAKLGRDQGFLSAIDYDPRTPITPGASFAADLLLHQPGAGRRNIDWDAIEVMNGTSLGDWLRYRTLWFSLLSQGFSIVGTANSDSHSLALEHAGYPRNLVTGDYSGATVDPQRFADDVRNGHLVGSNGPVLEVTMDDGLGNIRPLERQPFTATMAAKLFVVVTAAPWIPFDEVRIIVNGKTIRVNATTIPAGQNNPFEALFKDVDPYGNKAVSLPLTFFLENILADAQLGFDRDVWIVVEAGLKLPEAADVDGDGLPDLADGALAAVSGIPAQLSDYQAIVPGGWPVAFSNPFFLDLDGGGWQAPGLAP
jgi:hypothetical protein